ncbi:MULTISPECIES: DUF3299 domain-containing protein [unclassified Ruegeria]|uniref:DUF3299 domain-containing protein n=1 Tax=unclassified Ruegeria TaxID=2625375 RepID=UPI00209CBBAC|nr:MULTISPECIES: DUF3299 domain-containing protein [unclassified Ruegeria]
MLFAIPTARIGQFVALLHASGVRKEGSMRETFENRHPKQGNSWKRRRLLQGMAAVSLVPGFAAADEPVELAWGDLIPEGQSVPEPITGILQHGAASMLSQQPRYEGVRTDWNGQVVRLPGYTIPLEFNGTAVSEFILVPYVGACIHVPPPPANQMVFVKSEVQFEFAELFEPVWVTGEFNTRVANTHLADIAYELSAKRVDPYSD